MSTKIYNGFRLQADRDLFEFAASVRTSLGVVRVRTALADRIAEAVEAADAALLAGRPVPADPVSEAHARFVANQDTLRRSGQTMRYDYAPYSLSVSLGRDQHTGWVLGILHTENTELAEAFWALPGVERFGSWTGSDRPDDVSAADWAARRDAWLRVLPGAGVPAESMISFSLESALRTEPRPTLALAVEFEVPVTATRRRRRVAAVNVLASAAAAGGIAPMAAVMAAQDERSTSARDMIGNLLPDWTLEDLFSGNLGAVLPAFADPAATRATAAEVAACWVQDTFPDLS